MRVAFISMDAGVPIFGQKGCSVHVQGVVGALVKRGAQVELFSTSCDGEPCTLLNRVRIHRLPAVPKEDRASREQRCLALNPVLRAALERENPFDLVYERYSLWSFAAMEYARAARVPGLLEVNAPLVDEQAKYRSLVDRASAEQVADRVFGGATALLAVSDEVAEYLNGRPAARGKVHVIPNGVNPDRFLSKQKPSLPGPPGTFTVGFVGSLKPWHGLPVLVEAFGLLHNGHPNTRLLVVGDGPERECLMADLGARRLLAATQLTGAVAPDQVPGLLASMDVAVAPYPKISPFYFSPLKVYEYMAAGLPVVASRIGQLENLIQDGENGLLTTPGDLGSLTEALRRLLANGSLREHLGAGARATICKGHTWDSVVDRIFRLIEPLQETRLLAGS